MKFIQSTLICFFGFMFLAYGQDQIWVLGNQGTPGNAATTIDFTGIIPSISLVPRLTAFPASNAMICDPNGNLLFYTNGNIIANANNDTMLNGDHLDFGPHSGIYLYGQPVFQGAIIVPESSPISSRYHLFHELFYPAFPGFFGLYHTVIDMQLDGGLGGVVTKSDTVLIDTLIEGRITACQHANGRDWWIIAPKWNSNTYHVILQTPDSIGHRTEQIGPQLRFDQGEGQAVFSPDGNWYCLFTWHNGLNLMNFDRCTGDFSNILSYDTTYFQDTTTTILNGEEEIGAAFSPNSRFLYLNTPYFVYQLDLSMPNPITTKIIVASYDGFIGTGNRTLFCWSQLAKNNKIYISSNELYLHTIDQPDMAGIGCNVLQHNVNLYTSNLVVPNYPTFSLGAINGSVCDTLENVSIHTGNRKFKEVNIFPNPAGRICYIEVPDLSNDDVQIFDVSGRLIKFNTLTEGNYIKLDLEKVPGGIYTVKVQHQQKQWVKKLVKE